MKISGNLTAELNDDGQILFFLRDIPEIWNKFYFMSYNIVATNKSAQIIIGTDGGIQIAAIKNVATGEESTLPIGSAIRIELVYI